MENDMHDLKGISIKEKSTIPGIYIVWGGGGQGKGRGPVLEHL